MGARSVINAIRADIGKTCALRAPTALSVRIKTIRTESAVTVNTK